MNRHPETFVEAAQLGANRDTYRPTWDFPGPFIDAYHEALANFAARNGTQLLLRNGRRWFPGVIEGWLRLTDAQKLYELAYFAPGDLLELGTYHGLSTTLLAEANRRAPARRKIASVDISPKFLRKARANLRSLSLLEDVALRCGDAAEHLDQLASEGRRFAFAFVDHTHAYEPVRAACVRLERVLLPGAFCLFHDFNDHRNGNPQHPKYGVYQGVHDGLDASKYEFYGVYGCTGLYRLKGAAGGGPPG